MTGASSGVGEQLAAILYQHNAKIYLAARSEEKAQQAIQRIKTAVPSSKGDLIFLHLDLGDLTTVKKSADDFLTKEEKLDVLWNNAGVMVPPEGSKTTQGLDLEYGTNNVGPFLFTHFLHPVLAKTARVAPPNSVRVIWVSSSLAAFCAPKPAIDFDNMDYKKKEPKQQKYGRSKAGNILHSLEFSGRYKDEGILSLSLNPGNLKTDLQRHLPSLMNKYLVQPMLHHPRFGAYTELYAGLSLEITEKQNGAWGKLALCLRLCASEVYCISNEKG